MTSVVPPSKRAGSWYVSDLPAPVGITPIQSRPDSTASMIRFLPWTEGVVAEGGLQRLAHAGARPRGGWDTQAVGDRSQHVDLFGRERLRLRTI